MNNFIYPWQQQIWQSLHQRQQQARMPHALLLMGTEGVGKLQLALTLANAMLCNSPTENGFACEHCKTCHLTKAGSHPDFKLVTPEEKSTSIKIDQIREVVEFVNETALQGGHRVIVINPATAMNTNAANALLKTLEEPTPNTLIMLICHQSLRLPATITSRCQRIHFHKPEKAIALEWLKNQPEQAAQDNELLLTLANGAPLKARELIEHDILTLRKDLHHCLLELSQKKADPLQKAAKWQDQNLPALFQLCLLWLKDVLRCKLMEEKVDVVNQDFKADLDVTAKRISLENLLPFIDHVQQAYMQSSGVYNLNKLLLVEETFIKWSLCF